MKFLQIIIDKANDKLCPFCNIKLSSIENLMNLIFDNYQDLYKCNLCNLQYATRIYTTKNKDIILSWEYNSYILSFYWDNDSCQCLDMNKNNSNIFNIYFKYQTCIIDFADTNIYNVDNNFRAYFLNEIKSLNTIEEFQSLCDKIIKQEVFK